MTKISEIPTLSLDDLRPIVQRALELPDWPGDWPAAGLIFTLCRVHTSRMSAPPQTFEVRIMSLEPSGPMATSIDPDPLTALFRAFILWKARRM